MPEPLGGRRYAPGLDGLRALAVTAVVLYHLGLPWASGGLLGVGVFFTLSGYLITDILLGGQPRLGAFWGARARRLLPALLVLLALVPAWVAVAGPATPGLGAAVAAALAYMSNWQLVFQHVSYFDRFAAPRPLDHLWSLGVEEQFYLVWPLLLLLGVRLVRERRRPAGLRPRLALVTLVLAGASALEMALLYRPGFDASRVYYGTDTRAFELLIGAALAMVWPSRQLSPRVAGGARLLFDVAGTVALAAIAVLVWRTNEYSPFLYPAGFVLLSLATALLVAVLVHPAARLGRVLGVAPLRWLGVRSYAIYLWHLPVLALTTPAGEHRVQLLRATLQVGATVALAALSWRLVEEPVRHGRRARLPRRALSVAVPAAALAAIAAVALAATNRTTAPRDMSGARPQAMAAPDTSGARPQAMAAPDTSGARPRDKAPRAMTHRDVPPAKRRLRTSCRAVVDVGDSTSEGLTSPSYLPNPKQRIEARYAAVGATIQHYEISGARSIVETYEGQPNAADVVTAWMRDGYRGCWVLALGTNDTANVAVGSHVGRLQRIDELMSLIGKRAPVLWIDVRSLLSSGPYAEHEMELWNEALLQACRRHRNMRVYDWSSAVRDSWFIADGIHYDTPGYAARASLIAKALAHAFPATGQSRRCVIR